MSARASVVMSVLFVAIGVAIIVRTIALGTGGGLGLLLGGLFVVAGGLRLWTRRAWRD